MSALLERVQREGNPLIDGDQVTFVWEGEAHAPQLVGDFTNWGERPITLTHVERGVWAHTVALPRDAYVEYSFIYKPDIEERLVDPHSRHVIWNGVDSVNDTFTMPGFAPSPLTTRQPNVARGAVSEHQVPAGRWLATPHRRTLLYKPPVDEPVPLVIVWDGGDYIGRAQLNIIVDNLIAQKRIRPIALACIDNGQQARLTEYFCNDSTISFLLSQLLPYAHKHLKLVNPADEPGAYGVLGASMGGLMALYTALRIPQLFGHVVSQAGAFFIDDQVETMIIDHLVESLPVKPIKIWQDVGTLDWLLLGNRAMHERLVRKGYDVTYHEYSAGHNYTIWSNYVERGLEAVYGV
ncbi:MAG: alpha/beta hydrolase-fold protein [Chloroflexota bacterium]|nr:alpha/beta hydrolase-fold protein [Chloroflexota bacterium]